MDDYQKILDSIRRLVRLLRLADRAAQTSVGLSAAQLFVLAEVGKTPSLSLGELAERTRTDQSSVSTVVTRLTAAGLVRRGRARDDARRLSLTITRAGRTALDNAPPVAQERLIEAVARLTAAKRRTFAALFESLVEALGTEGGEPPMLFEEPGRARKARSRK